MLSHDAIRNMLVSQLGLSDLPADMQEKVISQFGENVLKRVTVAVLEKLPEEKRDEFARLTEAEDATKMQAFLKENIPDLDAVVGEEARKELEEFNGFRDSL